MQKQKEHVRKGELSNGTVAVLSAVLLLFFILLYFALKTDAPALIFVGVGFILIGVLVTLPNVISWIKGKHRESLIKQGKLVEEQKKTFHPGSRFDD